MASFAASCFTRLECFFSIVTLTTILAGVHISHLDLYRNFLHLENLGMTVITFEAFVCMNFAVKSNFS